MRYMKVTEEQKEKYTPRLVGKENPTPEELRMCQQVNRAFGSVLYGKINDRVEDIIENCSLAEINTIAVCLCDMKIVAVQQEDYEVANNIQLMLKKLKPYFSTLIQEQYELKL